MGIVPHKCLVSVKSIVVCCEICSVFVQQVINVKNFKIVK